ncbi:hypothetical protein CWC45_12730 [Neisseria sp. N177_16]|nr:hypothetical protein CWC45_12730 [Neisseria sp. N177_16]
MDSKNSQKAIRIFGAVRARAREKVALYVGKFRRLSINKKYRLISLLNFGRRLPLAKLKAIRQ